MSIGHFFVAARRNKGYTVTETARPDRTITVPEMHPKLQEVHDALPHGPTLAALQEKIDALDALAQARGKAANANLVARRAAEKSLGECRAEIAKLYESIGRRDS